MCLNKYSHATDMPKKECKKYPNDHNWCPFNQQDCKDCIISIKNRYRYKESHANLSCLDISNVTDMSSMFYRVKIFNGDLSSWDVSKVETMEDMFLTNKFDMPHTNIINTAEYWYKNNILNKDLKDHYNIKSLPDFYKHLGIQISEN